MNETNFASRSESVSQVDSATQQLDSFSYDDEIVRMFALATLVWGLVATIVGLIVAILLVVPQWTFMQYISFGRLRPLHTNAAIFAFAGNAIFAAVYYSTQRLCKARMWSDLLSNLHFWGWQLIIVAAAITLPLGITQSKEYAELEWPIDICDRPGLGWLLRCQLFHDVGQASRTAHVRGAVVLHCHDCDGRDSARVQQPGCSVEPVQERSDLRRRARRNDAVVVRP